MKIASDLSHGRAIYGDLLQFENDPLTIRFDDGDIVRIKQCLSFPGFVNSHDHLDFDLFPMLINRRYDGYESWGADIHRHNKQEIDRVRAVPLSLRVRWGVLKNLLNGFTDVIHHGLYHDAIREIHYPVFLDYRYLHAIGTERWWKAKLNLPEFKDVMIHSGEGIGKAYTEEIQSLINWNLLSKGLIAIHAIGMTPEQSRKFKALVWCPESNMNLYGATAPIDTLKQHTRILFGTDSTVSASANHWQHLRNARTSGLMDDEEIFAALTQTANDIFKLKRRNSFVITAGTGNGWDSLFSTDPKDILLVSIDDRVQLVDATIKTMNPDDFTLIELDSKRKWIRRELADVVRSLEAHGVALPLNVKAL